MKYADKLVLNHCYIVIVFFEDCCHVSLTTRGEKYISSLKKLFLKLDRQAVDSFIFDLGYLNHWDRVHEKYAWRYMMSEAGYALINQDGSMFVDVHNETWETARALGESLKRRFAIRPIAQVLATEKVRRRVRFLPLQAIRTAVDAADLERRKYSEFERRLTHKSYVCGADIPPKVQARIRKKRPIGKRKTRSSIDVPF